MIARDVLQKIGESLGSTAAVKSVFGEPIHVEGRTVAPVARMAYAFGAGAGARPAHGDDQKAEGGGGGGGCDSLSGRRS